MKFQYDTRNEGESTGYGKCMRCMILLCDMRRGTEKV